MQDSMAIFTPMASTANLVTMADHTRFHETTYSYKRASSNEDDDEGDNEDWRKLDDLASRRRIQNRISQRKRRRRIKEEQETGSDSRPRSSSTPAARSPHGRSASTSKLRDSPPDARPTPPFDQAPFLTHGAYCVSSTPYFSSTLSSSSGGSSSLLPNPRSHRSHSSVSSFHGTPNPSELVHNINRSKSEEPGHWTSAPQVMHSIAATQFPDFSTGMDQPFENERVDEGELLGMFGDFGIFKPTRPSRSPSYVSDYSVHSGGFGDVLDGDFATLTQAPASYDMSCEGFEMPYSQDMSLLSAPFISMAQALDPSIANMPDFHPTQNPTINLTASPNPVSTSYITPTPTRTSTPTPNPSNTNASSSPLHAAASAGHTSVVSILLNTGISPDTLCSKGSSPLHLAIAGAHFTTVALLIASGADCNLKNAQGQNALHLAVERGSKEMVELIIGHITVDQRAEMDARGRTPLLVAAERGDEDVVRLIIGSQGE